jgi:hypothetical protein
MAPVHYAEHLQQANEKKSLKTWNEKRPTGKILPGPALHMKIKAAKAWAGYCHAHLGQNESKTMRIVHPYRTTGRTLQPNITARPPAPQTLCHISPPVAAERERERESRGVTWPTATSQRSSGAVMGLLAGAHTLRRGARRHRAGPQWCSKVAPRWPKRRRAATTTWSLWQNHLRNEGSVFQDPDRLILDEARMHVNTHMKHLKP